MKDHKLSAGFARLLDDRSERGWEVVPRLRAYLYDAEVPPVTIVVDALTSRREPDGWFHPSSHPMWSEAQLYVYLTAPDKLVPDPLEYEGATAVSAGTFFHGFLQHAGLQEGVFVEREGERCDCGGKWTSTHNRAEVYAEDRETMSRGHEDGETDSGKGVEIKTAHPAVQEKCRTLQGLIASKPHYYAQVQDYMRMVGWEATCVVFISMVYPFPMTEVLVPFDKVFAMKLREKYLRVREAVERGAFPYRGCCGEPKDCPARVVCPAS